MEKTITGQVTDENDEGLPGVNVLVKNTTTGTVTDMDGNYWLNVQDDASVLVFSSVGYITEEVNIGNQTFVNVQIKIKVPFLYDLEVSLIHNGQQGDQVKSYFGMREIRLGKDEEGFVRLFLNDQPLLKAWIVPGW